MSLLRRTTGVLVGVALVAALAVAGALRLQPLVSGPAGHPVTSFVTSTPEVGQAEALQPQPPPPPPSRLSIPALGVDATVEAVGVDADGRMAPPTSPEHVGWYQMGPRPGQAGSAVLDGHLDWWTGPAVFWRLDRLHVGDRLVVTREDGTQVVFVVVSTGVYPYDSPPTDLFATSGIPSLALITCAGVWDRTRDTYLQRLVVRAAYAPAALAQPPPEAG